LSKIKDWIDLSETLKVIKEAEMRLRKELCVDILQGLAFPCKKTVTLDGIEVKAENGISYGIDEAAVKYKPSLVMAAYKKLPKDSLLHEVVTSKPTAPTLKVL
jgi:hypothetical protein